MLKTKSSLRMMTKTKDDDVEDQELFINTDEG